MKDDEDCNIITARMKAKLLRVKSLLLAFGEVSFLLMMMMMS